MVTSNQSAPLFTPRQTQIIASWVRYDSVPQAAAELNIAVNTFNEHLKRMRRKIHANRTLDVYLYMLRTGLLPAPTLRVA